MTSRAPVNGFTWISSLAIPGVTTGPTITPGNNTYGTPVQVLSSAQITDDAFGVIVNFNGIAVSAAARDCIGQVLVDPAGGTSYQVLLPDLLCACAGLISGTGLGGVTYYFPIFVKANSSVAVALSVNNATVGTGSAYVKLATKPTGPVIPRVGTFVRAFGVNTGTSSGTTVVPTTSGVKSSFVQLGSAMTDPLWGFCLGVGLNQAVVSNNNACTWDLGIGDATTRQLAIDNQVAIPTTAEVLTYTSEASLVQRATGDLLYARAGTSGVVFTGWSAAAYGIGG